MKRLTHNFGRQILEIYKQRFKNSSNTHAEAILWLIIVRAAKFWKPSFQRLYKSYKTDEKKNLIFGIELMTNSATEL